MKNKKFWNWKSRKTLNQETNEEIVERVLSLNGTIAEESWFDDDVTPQFFKDELNAGSGDITVWINSPGGDCVAAAQIYNMLADYKGNVTVKIDGIAASAASVIAMAGDNVLMSPVSMMMIHNPATVAFGDHTEMAKAIEMLEGVKDSIINAYSLKTGMSRAKLSRLMDAEHGWMQPRRWNLDLLMISSQKMSSLKKKMMSRMKMASLIKKAPKRMRKRNHPIQCFFHAKL